MGRHNRRAPERQPGWMPPTSIAPETYCLYVGVCEASGKFMYPTHIVADEALTVARRRRIYVENSDHMEQRSYLCPSCDHFHLTSRPLR